MADKKSDNITFDANGLVYSDYKPNLDLSDMEISDSWYAPWVSDIVDQSEDAISELSNIAHDVVMDSRRLEDEVLYFEKESIAKIDAKIAERQARDTAANIDDLKALKDKVEAAVKDMSSYIKTDAALLKTLYENTKTDVDTKHARLKVISDGDNDGSKQSAALKLNEQAVEINSFGKESVIIVNAASARANEIMRNMSAAITQEEPAIIIPTMLSLMELQIPTPEEPVSNKDARNIFSKQFNVLQVRIAEMEDYYDSAKTELADHKIKFGKELTSLINDSSTTVEDKAKYEAIEKQWKQSIVLAEAEIDSKQDVFLKESAEINKKMDSFETQIQSAGSSINMLNTAVTSQAQSVNAFLIEQHYIPKGFIPDIKANIVDQYQKDLINKTLAANAHGLNGPIAAAPIIMTAPAAPQDKDAALKTFSAEKDHVTSLKTDIDQFYADLTLKVDTYATDKIKDLDALAQIASPEEKEKYEKIKKNLEASIAETRATIAQEKLVLNMGYDALGEKMDANGDKLNLSGLTAPALAKVLNENHGEVAAFTSKHYNMPKAIEAKFDGITALYTNDIASITVAAEPHKLGVVTAPAPLPNATVQTTTSGGTPIIPPAPVIAVDPASPNAGLQRQANKLVNEIYAVTGRSNFGEFIAKDSNGEYNKLDTFKIQEHNTQTLIDSLKAEGKTHDAAILEKSMVMLKENHENAHDALKGIEAHKAILVPIRDRVTTLAGEIGKLSGTADKATLQAYIIELDAAKKSFTDVYDDIDKKNKEIQNLAATNHKILNGSNDPNERYKYPGNKDYKYTYGGDKIYNDSLENLLGGKGNPLYNFFSHEPGQENGLSSAFNVVSGWFRGATNAWDQTKRNAHPDDLGKLNMIGAGAGILAVIFGTNMVGGKWMPTWAKIGIGIIGAGYFIHGMGGDAEEMKNNNVHVQAQKGVDTASTKPASGNTPTTESVASAPVTPAKGEDKTNVTGNSTVADASKAPVSNKEEISTADITGTGNGKNIPALDLNDEGVEIVSFTPNSDDNDAKELADINLVIAANTMGSTPGMSMGR